MATPIANLEHELFEITSRLKLKAARLTEKALDKLELILETATDTPETIRRTAVNIFSLLGIPTAQVKHPSPSLIHGTPAPRFPTALELTEALEKVHQRSNLRSHQARDISEALSYLDTDPQALLAEIRRILSGPQEELFLLALSGRPLRPVRDTKPPAFTPASDATPAAPTPTPTTDEPPATPTPEPATLPASTPEPEPTPAPAPGPTAAPTPAPDTLRHSPKTAVNPCQSTSVLFSPAPEAKRSSRVPPSTAPMPAQPQPVT